MTVRFEKIKLSGIELDLDDQPVIIRDGEALVITSNGTIVWQKTGPELARLAIPPLPPE